MWEEHLGSIAPTSHWLSMARPPYPETCELPLHARRNKPPKCRHNPAQHEQESLGVVEPQRFLLPEELQDLWHASRVVHTLVTGD